MSHGRAAVHRVRTDPDDLVLCAADRHNARIDWFTGLALDAHIAATGHPFPVDGPPGPDEPTGAHADLTDEATMRRQFPKITAYLDANPWIARPWDPAAD